MAETEETEQSREEALRRLLADAVEVQLAALKAGISFWTEWIEQTSVFVQSATRSLSTFNAEDQETKDVLLELVDAGRASIRAMTEIPRNTATRFIEELDRIEEQKAEAAKKAAKKTSRKKPARKSASAKRAAKKRGSAKRPRRATRVKD